MQSTVAQRQIIDHHLKIIGNNIHKARLHRKITLTKLSRLTGLNSKTIDYYEMGRKYLNIRDLIKIAIALNVKPEKLLQP